MSKSATGKTATRQETQTPNTTDLVVIPAGENVEAQDVPQEKQPNF